MNIEVIINLVILFFIVSSVFKRFKDVQKKADEIKKPTDHPPLEHDDPIKEFRRALLEDKEKRAVPEDRPVEFRNDLSDVIDLSRPISQGEGTDQLVEAEFGDQEWERRLRELDELKEKTRNEVNAVRGKGLRYKRLREENKPVRIDDFQFDTESVVQGFVMSEILGPPVSLRKESAR